MHCWNTKSNLDFWPQINRSSPQSQATHVWCVITLCRYHAKFKVIMWPWPLTYLSQNQKRSSGHGQYMCEVSSMDFKRNWSYSAETVKSLKSEFDLDLLTLKSIEVFLGMWLIHLLSIINVRKKEKELLCRNGNKFKDRTWPAFFCVQVFFFYIVLYVQRDHIVLKLYSF